MNPRFLFFIVFGVVLLGGMFFVFKPSESLKQSVSVPSTPDATTVPTVSTDKTFTLEVKEKKLVSGEQTLRVTQGDTVTIMITSDEAEELHVHGYDVSVDLEPNKQAKISFVADVAGRFPYELEMSKVEIGALEVQPK